MAETQTIRPCLPDETGEILAIVNAAAEAYRGVLPDDCWRDPYMPAAELAEAQAAGVAFWGAEDAGRLIGVMGLQPVRDVTLIRHAYVRPERQGEGTGGALLRFLEARIRGPILIGTWAAADWAVRFYQGHGYALVSPQRTPAVLSAYWTISPRQIETSVVLAKPPLG